MVVNQILSIHLLIFIHLLAVFIEWQLMQKPFLIVKAAMNKPTESLVDRQ